MKANVVRPTIASKHDLQSQLNLAGWKCPGEYSKAGAICTQRAGRSKIRAVQQIESFGAELHIFRLRPEPEVLVKTEVQVVERWIVCNISSSGAKWLCIAGHAEGGGIQVTKPVSARQ